MVLGTASITNAQFVDSFEAYTVGTFLGVASPDWTTWSDAPGGVEDVQIANTDAHSGTNSIYFSSVLASGGPQDVVLPFGAAHNTGHLMLDAWFKVEPNKGAYINFQSEVVTAVTWALECFMVDNGDLIVVSDAATVITGTYLTDVWFKMTWDVDLELNVWELLIDGISKGSFSNTNNQIASLNIFPVNNETGANNICGYWVDDVSFTYTPPGPGVGIAEVREQPFTMYPNPTSEDVTLVIDAVAPQIFLTDVLGRRVYAESSAQSHGQIRIATKNLASGIYQVHVRDGNAVSAQTLVVE